MMEQDEGGGDDRADPPGAEADPAQRLERGLQQGVAAFGLGTDGDVQRVEGALIGGERAARGIYHLRHSLTSGPADRAFGYGEHADIAVTGDWNGDGIDTLGVRRVPAPPPTTAFGDGTHRVGAAIAPST